MRTTTLCAILAALAAFLALFLACSGSGDDDDSGGDGPDDDDDNDSGQADDDDGSSNQLVPPDSCGAIAADLSLCGLTLADLDGNAVDAAGLTVWCQRSAEIFGQSGEWISPFWTCLGGCAYNQTCDSACFDGCRNPAAPTAPDCAVTTHEVYACGYQFPISNSAYWMPEMDLQQACSGMQTWDWECFHDCLLVNLCDSPPADEQTVFLENCLVSSCGA
jgi:hypothetical protein